VTPADKPFYIRLHQYNDEEMNDGLNDAKK